jgi:hypothetical protein
MVVRTFYSRYNPNNIHVEYFFNIDGVPLMSQRHRSRSLRQWSNAGEFDVTIYANDLGFRSKKNLQKLPANTIYAVGDSFSFGHGVEEEERFSSLLEYYSGIPVANISIPTDILGYEAILNYATSNGANIKKIIISICMENDIFDYSEKLLANRNLVINKKKRPIKMYMKQKSALYNFVAATTKQNKILLNFANQLSLIRQPSLVIYTKDVSSSVERLTAIRDKYDAKILLLIIPSRGLWGQKEPETFDFMHRRFVQEVQARGFDVLDLRNSLEENGSPLDYHYTLDGHWNTLGHKLAAKKLAEHINMIDF